MPMLPRKPWTPDELMLALHLYLNLPFGSQDARNGEVKGLAERLGRTPGSVAMKLNNLTSVDPLELARGITGLPGASRADKALFEAYLADPVEILARADTLWHSASNNAEPGGADNAPPPPFTHEAEPSEEFTEASSWAPKINDGPTDRWTTKKVRIGQRLFRRNLVVAYKNRCAVTGIAVENLLTASHIKPWAVADDIERVSPQNGLLLSPFYNAAFDQGLITLDEHLRWLVGKSLMSNRGNAEIAHHVEVLHQHELEVPTALRPAIEFVRYHRECVFRG
jgi:putative restriction endonuclease